MWIAFDNSYARLPERFHARVSPTPVAAPRLIRLNVALAESLGLDPAALASPDGVAMLAGNRVEAGSEPIAAAYAGHQFGGFSPQLGDGRAILLGEIIGRDGIRRDLQLKGSGRTPFSRGGDGRAALGPVLREYLISEAMWALGIKTTRSLAAVLTGEAVARETMLPGAVLTRVATSHIRVGTFQFFAARGDLDATRLLADHVIARHYPDAAHAARPYRALLDAVVAAQADLVARWLLIGFIHGVMNTDNTSVAGETIDYGPCAFMDAYDPATVFSSIDHAGRYAYSNQPSIAHWNVARLAEALMPLMDTDEGRALEQAKESLGAFAGQFETAYMGGLARKIGLQTERQGDAALIRDLLTRMGTGGADFTLTFRRLSEPDAGTRVRTLFTDPAAFDAWEADWRARLAHDAGDAESRGIAMRAINPAFIPRNHRVQAAIDAGVERQDFAPFEELLEVLSRPFDDRPEFARYMEPPDQDQRVYQTFCGT